MKLIKKYEINGNGDCKVHEKTGIVLLDEIWDKTRIEIGQIVGYEHGSSLDLAVWEMLKNAGLHRIKHTIADIRVFKKRNEYVIETRNQYTQAEARECLDNNCLDDCDKLELTHFRGEDIIRAYVGESRQGKSNYERTSFPFPDPTKPFMICRIHIPTNTNKKAAH